MNPSEGMGIRLDLSGACGERPRRLCPATPTTRCARLPRELERVVRGLPGLALNGSGEPNAVRNYHVDSYLTEKASAG